MNSLNLRVSSVKTGENVRKNAELRTALLKLPSKYLDSSANDKDFVVAYKSAQSISEQVEAVKNIYGAMQNDGEILRFLTDIYFIGPLKHPVRNQIAKLLSIIKVDDTPQILVSVNSSMTQLLSTVTESKDPSDLNRVVTSLSGCFDNFPLALQAIQQNIETIFSMLLKSLGIFTLEASSQSSPSVKNDLYLYIHNLVRFVLACIQEFSGTISEKLKVLIIAFVSLARDLILDDDIPMDVKTNSGILIAYNAKIQDSYAEHVNCIVAQDIDTQNNCLVLCLCIGTINTITSHALNKIADQIYKVVEKICLIAYKHSAEPPMLLNASRVLLQTSKLLLLFDISNGVQAAVKSIVAKLTQFVLSFLEHHIDSVRHLCKDLIRNVIKINQKLNFEDFTNDLFEFCNQTDTPLSTKCLVLIAISNTIGTEVILRNVPTLLDTLIKNGLEKDLNVLNCYESLMIGHHKQIDFNKWTELWIVPLLKLSTEEKSLLGTVEVLINKAIKYNPKLVSILVDIENKDISLSTRFSALWTVRKNGLQGLDSQNTLKSFSSLFKTTMVSNDDDTKIMALRLVVESHKTTELLCDVECEAIFEFLRYNSNCQSPAIRQKSLALISKGLIRLKISIEKSLKTNNCRLDYYRDFFKRLIGLLVDNLFVGANFSRRSVSLNLLQQSVKIVVDCGEDTSNYLPPNISTKLIEALNDSYESNKALAISILKVITEETCQISLDTIKQLMISVRPTDSLTSAYYLEYFCLRPDPFDLTKTTQHLSTQNPVEVAAIWWCIEILESGLTRAQDSILLASRENPLYGAVLTIRLMLSKLNFKELASDSQWQTVFAKLISLCRKLTEVVGPVVNSSSPEGHLPNDFSEIPAYLGKHDEIEDNRSVCKVLSPKQNTSGEILKTTPQMVLLCAWRTVKEVSLLLGDIVLGSPIKPEAETFSDYLITVDQIINIGDHFKELLSETKHRGAFEQAYVGFSKVCVRLWRTAHSDLYKLPMMWLKELIDIISKDEKINEKICATRRSAGVPFMVQALITSELQVGTTKALSYCMKHLTSLCSDLSRSTESRTHALNILRALFRCSDLNEAVGEYVAAGVMIAINGYSASTWAERNSSTLLFSALITRIFGVQRTKDWENLCIRNRMTGRIFFLRYPQLYDFFSVELKEASDWTVKKNERPQKLHPLLLLLSRLYPSALEGMESNLKVCSFIDYISTCSGSAEMTTRVLAAKAIVAFMTPDTIEKRCNQVFQEIMILIKHKQINQNYIHGLLLQILFMLKSQKTLSSIFLNSTNENISNVLSFLKPNPVTWKVLLDISLEIYRKSSHNYSGCPAFSRFHEIYTPEFSRTYPVFRKSLFLFTLQTIIISSHDEILHFFITCFESILLLTYEEVATCLNIILLLFFNAEDERAIYECCDTEINFVDSLDQSYLRDLRITLRTSENLRKCLNQITLERRFYPECTIKAYAILSRLSIIDIDFSKYILMAKQYPDDVKDSMSKCLESYVASSTLTENELLLCLNFLEDLALPWNSDLLRLTAAKMTHNIVTKIFGGMHTLESKTLTHLVNIMLCLLRDDDSDVRDHICETIVILSNCTNGNISASYAPIVLIRYLSGILRKLDNTELTQQVIQDIVRTQIIEVDRFQNDEDGDEGEVFDRNEANVFAEPYRTLIDCLETFKECFNDSESVKKIVDAFLQEYCSKRW